MGLYFPEPSRQIDARDFGIYPSDNDVAPELQAACNSLPAGSQLIFPPGTFRLGSTVTCNGKALRLSGSAVPLGASGGTRFLRVADVPAFVFAGTAGARVAGLMFEHLQVDGETSYTSDALRLSYQTRMLIFNLGINFSGGNGLYLDSVWDSLLLFPICRYCGSYANTKAALFLEGPLDDTRNNNSIRVVFGHLEHGDYGPLLINAGPLAGAVPGVRNDQIKFTNTKFEPSGRPVGSMSPIILRALSHSAFTECDFSLYATGSGTGRCFDIEEGTTGLEITGNANNSVAPESFARVVDSANVKVDVRGFLVGDVTQTGSSWGGRRDIADASAPIRDRRFILDFPPVQTIDARTLANASHTCLDDAASPTGSALRANTVGAGTTVLNRGLGGLGTMGITYSVQCRLATGSTGGSTFVLELTNGATTVTLATFTPTTSYATVSGSVPRALVNASTTLRIRSGTSTEVLQIAGAAWREGLQGAEIAGLAYQAGETLWATAPAAGASPGKVCTTAGVAGSGAVFKDLPNLAA